MSGLRLCEHLVSLREGTDVAVAEFYIVPTSREHGVGRAVMKALFLAHPGVWELKTMPLNAPARRFWPAAISAAGANDLQEFDVDGEIVHRFTIMEAT
jgi:predicted acetyltransferase